MACLQGEIDTRKNSERDFEEKESQEQLIEAFKILGYKI